MKSRETELLTLIADGLAVLVSTGCKLFCRNLQINLGGDFRCSFLELILYNSFQKLFVKTKIFVNFMSYSLFFSANGFKKFETIFLLFSQIRVIRL